MIFIQHYDSPLGGILLAADETGLTGLWFEGQKFFARDLPAERVEQNTPADRMVSALTSPSVSCIRCQMVAWALVEICCPMMWWITEENSSGSAVRSICPTRSMTSPPRQSMVKLYHNQAGYAIRKLLVL